MLPPDNLVPLRASERLNQASAFIHLHDPENAAEILESLSALKFSQAEITRSIIRARIDAERGDWGGALAEIEKTNASNHGETVKELAAYNKVFAAELNVHAGRNEEADTLVTSSSPDNYEGWLARGRIAILRKNYVSGEQALAEAVRRAPSIPRAYHDWGDLLYAKGDYSGAISKYSDANQRGPHWADPLKAWGDVLVKQGKTKEALIKFDEARKYAPNWEALKEAHEVTARHASEH
jgi:tetratricopeptide (TPR) repeat protein